MAESTKKDNNPAKEFEPADNTTLPNGGEEAETTPSTQAEKWLKNYLKDPLLKDIADTESEQKVNCLSYWEQQKVNALKVCRLQHAQKVTAEYLAIKNCVSSTLYKHTERIDANIDLLKKKNGLIQKQLNTALENLKAVKSALGEVNKLSCDLDRARHDACHSKQRDAMSDLPESNEVSGIQRFQDEVTAIVNNAKELSGKGNVIFESGVKIAGIQSFVNIASLKPQSEKLKTDSGKLEEDIAKNLEEMTAKAAECQEEYLEGINKITGSLFDLRESELLNNALDNLNEELDGDLDDSLCNDSQFSALRDRLEGICQGVEDALSLSVTCTPDQVSKFKKTT